MVFTVGAFITIYNTCLYIDASCDVPVCRRRHYYQLVCHIDKYGNMYLLYIYLADGIDVALPQSSNILNLNSVFC